MKIRTLLVLVFCILFLSLIALTAQHADSGGAGGAATPASSNPAATIKKVWQQPDNVPLVPNVRLELMQVSVSLTSTEPLRYLALKSRGTAKLADVFDWMVVIVNDEVVGEVRTGGVEPLYVHLPNTAVLPHLDIHPIISGETKFALNNEADKKCILEVSAIVVGDANQALEPPLVGGTHSVFPNVKVGTMASVSRFGGIESATVGQNRYLGSLAFVIEGDDIDAAPQFIAYTTGGAAEDLQNVHAVHKGGATFPITYVKTLSYGLGLYQIQSDRHPLFTKGEQVLYFAGDIGSSFSRGGTIALATNPSKWPWMRGATHTYEPTRRHLPLVIGPTVHIKGPRLVISTKAPEYSWVGSGQSRLVVLTYILDARESSVNIKVSELPFWILTAPQWMADISKAGFADNLMTPLVGTSTLHGKAPSDWVANYSTKFESELVVKRETMMEVHLWIDLSDKADGYYGFGILDMGNVRATDPDGNSPTVIIHPGWHIIRASPGHG